MKLAYRLLSAGQSSTSGKTLTGLVAPYDQQSARPIPLSNAPNAPVAVETIDQGAFDVALREAASGGRSIRALVNHVPFAMLGSTRAGTVRLDDQTDGLHSVITPPDSPLGEELLALGTRDGELGMSFGFRPDTSRYTSRAGVRHLQNIDLYEISVLTLDDGAYSAAHAATRALYGVHATGRDTPERDALFAAIMVALRRT